MDKSTNIVISKLISNNKYIYKKIKIKETEKRESYSLPANAHEKSWNDLCAYRDANNFGRFKPKTRGKMLDELSRHSHACQTLCVNEAIEKGWRRPYFKEMDDVDALNFYPNPSYNADSTPESTNDRVLPKALSNDARTIGIDERKNKYGGLNIESFAELCNHRVELGIKPTPTALNTVIKELIEYPLEYQAERIKLAIKLGYPAPNFDKTQKNKFNSSTSHSSHRHTPIRKKESMSPDELAKIAASKAKFMEVTNPSRNISNSKKKEIRAAALKSLERVQPFQTGKGQLKAKSKYIPLKNNKLESKSISTWVENTDVVRANPKARSVQELISKVVENICLKNNKLESNMKLTRDIVSNENTENLLKNLRMKIV